MKNRVLFISSFIPMAVTLVVLQFFPDQVPMHYDVYGNIDRWGSKYEELLFPVIILLLSLMWQCMINYFEKKAEKTDNEKEQVEAQSNAKILNVVAISMAIVHGIMHFVFLYSAYIEARINAAENAIDKMAVCNILLAAALIIIGNYLPRAKPNSVVGFRTTKSLSDEVIWKKSNRFAGIMLMIAGVIIIIASVIYGGMISTLIMVGVLIAVSFITVIYSAII